MRSSILLIRLHPISAWSAPWRLSTVLCAAVPVPEQAARHGHRPRAPLPQSSTEFVREEAVVRARAADKSHLVIKAETTEFQNPRANLNHGAIETETVTRILPYAVQCRTKCTSPCQESSACHPPAQTLQTPPKRKTRHCMWPCTSMHMCSTTCSSILIKRKRCGWHNEEGEGNPPLLRNDSWREARCSRSEIGEINQKSNREAICSYSIRPD